MSSDQTPPSCRHVFPGEETRSPLATLAREGRREDFPRGGAAQGVQAGGDVYGSTREGRSGAARTAELRELRCPVSAPHSPHHLPPGKQEPQSCKFPLLFLPVPGWSSPGAVPSRSHSPPLSQRLPVPAAPRQQVSRRRTITSIGK